MGKMKEILKVGLSAGRPVGLKVSMKVKFGVD
jgi:hypothetical protein